MIEWTYRTSAENLRHFPSPPLPTGGQRRPLPSSPPPAQLGRRSVVERGHVVSRLVLSAAVLCLIVAACGGESMLDPDEVAIAVDATLTALAPTTTPTWTDRRFAPIPA